MNKRPYESCANLLRVISHPTRIAILYALRHGAYYVNEVCESLGVTQPNLSQHLSILRREGILSFSEEGAKRRYFITNPDVMEPLLDVLLGNCDDRARVARGFSGN